MEEGQKVKEEGPPAEASPKKEQEQAETSTSESAKTQVSPTNSNVASNRLSSVPAESGGGEVGAEPAAKEEAPSPKKNKELKRQKKMKMDALKDFLSKPEDGKIEVQRREEEKVVEPPPEQVEVKEATGDPSIKRKQCQFCKENVPASQIRKKRKQPNGSKFVRICDSCEDQFIFDRYMKSESKAEEALAMQEMIVQSKRNQLAELANAKQTKLKILRNKQKELNDDRAEQESKLNSNEHDLDHKNKKMDKKIGTLEIEEEAIQKLEESLPRPLDDDFGCLQDQNAKITRQLVRYQKLCGQALKAKSTREKELYDAYYKWEKKETNKAAIKKKKEECEIY